MAPTKRRPPPGRRETRATRTCVSTGPSGSRARNTNRSPGRTRSSVTTSPTPDSEMSWSAAPMLSVPAMRSHSTAVSVADPDTGRRACRRAARSGSTAATSSTSAARDVDANCASTTRTSARCGYSASSRNLHQSCMPAQASRCGPLACTILPADLVARASTSSPSPVSMSTADAATIRRAAAGQLMRAGRDVEPCSVRDDAVMGGSSKTGPTLRRIMGRAGLGRNRRIVVSRGGRRPRPSAEDSWRRICVSEKTKPGSLFCGVRSIDGWNSRDRAVVLCLVGLGH